jgi:hypothetical protein
MQCLASRIRIRIRALAIYQLLEEISEKIDKTNQFCLSGTYLKGIRYRNIPHSKYESTVQVLKVDTYALKNVSRYDPDLYFG